MLFRSLQRHSSRGCRRRGRCRSCSRRGCSSSCRTGPSAAPLSPAPAAGAVSRDTPFADRISQFALADAQVALPAPLAGVPATPSAHAKLPHVVTAARNRYPGARAHAGAAFARAMVPAVAVGAALTVRILSLAEPTVERYVASVSSHPCNI